MKRWILYLFTLVAALVPAGAAAQGRYGSFTQPRKSMEMGISVGATAPFMTTHSSDGVALSPKAGMRAALMMALMWDDEYALQMELAYLYNNIVASRQGVEYDVKANIMEIPIMFSYRGLGAMRFNVGPVLSLAASGKYSNGFERIEFGRVRPTLGYTAGVGVAITQRLIVDARFTGGLRRTDNYFEGAEFRSSAYWATLNVSYLF